MKGICFKEPLFNKVVDGTKTQTRRIIICKRNKEIINISPLCLEEFMICEKSGSRHFGKAHAWFIEKERYGNPTRIDQIFPYIADARYRKGEIMFLKEPYCPSTHIIERLKVGIQVEYLYVHSTKSIERLRLHHWKNKLFMPEKYARYFIQITDVTAQRLQDITEKDAKVH